MWRVLRPRYRPSGSREFHGATSSLDCNMDIGMPEPKNISDEDEEVNFAWLDRVSLILLRFTFAC